ncbi:Glutaredoxin [Ectocarpus siliculosus]|uniref:Glutaredoxin n=1 Tax=Ectocarpus siliculosus TaxID=2880 RepID=D8LC00_ECTSI|nr:Glutaredoxin [Ectocarpus siliculosus]|eukprot:CBN79183.1 Glutaredoxin [Ectocarpus siliculosus]
MSEHVDAVNEMVGQHGVVVYSKTYCPFCTKAKKALKDVGAKYELIELDEVDNGSAIQDALQSITGQRSVPNVFIGGTSIGGGDDTVRLQKSGELLTKVTAVGAV